MTRYFNPDEVGNHFERYGYEGWPDLQDSDPWGDIPEFDEHETKENA